MEERGEKIGTGGAEVQNTHGARLASRLWLLHWGLFLFFPPGGGKVGGMDLVDFVLSDTRYLTAIQNAAPHLLRYLAAAAVVRKRGRAGRSRDHFSSIVDAIGAGDCKRIFFFVVFLICFSKGVDYEDPITRFLTSLYHQVDFEGAQDNLKQCEEVFDQDFFLSRAGLKAEFVENARLFLFET